MLNIPVRILFPLMPGLDYCGLGRNSDFFPPGIRESDFCMTKHSMNSACFAKVVLEIIHYEPKLPQKKTTK